MLLTWLVTFFFKLVDAANIVLNICLIFCSLLFSQGITGAYVPSTGDMTCQTGMQYVSLLLATCSFLKSKILILVNFDTDDIFTHHEAYHLFTKILIILNASVIKFHISPLQRNTLPITSPDEHFQESSMQYCISLLPTQELFRSSCLVPIHISYVVQGVLASVATPG